MRTALVPVSNYGSQLGTYMIFGGMLLAEGRAVRVVWEGRALPLPAQGAIVIGPADYTGRDDLIANAAVRGSFRFAELPPAARFAPTLALPRPVQFANGTSVLGFRPVAGAPPDERSWLLDLIWRVDAAPDTPAPHSPCSAPAAGASPHHQPCKLPPTGCCAA